MGEPGEILPARAFSDCSIFMGIRLATGCRCLLRSVSFILEEDRIIVRLRFEGVNPQTLPYVREQIIPKVSAVPRTTQDALVMVHKLRSRRLENLSAGSTHSSRELSTPTTRKRVAERLVLPVEIATSCEQHLVAIVRFVRAPAEY